LQKLRFSGSSHLLFLTSYFIYQGCLEAGCTTIERNRQKKKLQTCKPDSVSRFNREAIIYLVQPLLTGSFCLPTQRTRQ